MNESTPRLIIDIGIKITLSEIFVKKKKRRKGNFVKRYLPIINQIIHIDWEAEELPEI